MYSLREGPRGGMAPRELLSGRGVSYWTDGQGDNRVLYMTPGYRLVALNADTGIKPGNSTTTIDDRTVEKKRQLPLRTQGGVFNLAPLRAQV